MQREEDGIGIEEVPAQLTVVTDGRSRWRFRPGQLVAVGGVLLQVEKCNAARLTLVPVPGAMRQRIDVALREFAKDQAAGRVATAEGTTP